MGWDNTAGKQANIFRWCAVCAANEQALKNYSNSLCRFDSQGIVLLYRSCRALLPPYALVGAGIAIITVVHPSQFYKAAWPMSYRQPQDHSTPQQEQQDCDMLCAWLDGCIDSNAAASPTDLDDYILHDMLFGASCSVGHFSTAAQTQHKPWSPQLQQSSSSTCSGNSGVQHQPVHLQSAGGAETVPDILEAFDAFLQEELEQPGGSCQPNMQEQQQLLDSSDDVIAEELRRFDSLKPLNSNSGSGMFHAVADASAGLAVSHPASDLVHIAPWTAAAQQQGTLITQSQQQQQQHQQQQLLLYTQLCQQLSAPWQGQQWLPHQLPEAAAAAAAPAAAVPMTPVVTADSGSVNTTSCCCATCTCGGGSTACERSCRADRSSMGSMLTTSLQPPLQQQQLLMSEQHSQLIQQSLQQHTQLLMQQGQQQHLEQLREWQLQVLQQQLAQQQLAQQQQQQQQQQVSNPRVLPTRAQLQRQSISSQLQCQSSSNSSSQLQRQLSSNSSSQQNSSSQGSSQLFARRRAFNPLIPNKLLKVKAHTKVGCSHCQRLQSTVFEYDTKLIVEACVVGLAVAGVHTACITGIALHLT
jgi:hypothetical protein